MRLRRRSAVLRTEPFGLGLSAAPAIARRCGVNKPLNPDAYAFITLQHEYRDQMDRHARLRERARDVRDELDRIEADATTASLRATSIMETLLKLEQPRDAQVPA
jgi:hypothetical protein